MTPDRAALWIAQGFGLGRIPYAPGTFGSALGFAWFLLLLAPGHFALFATAILASFFAAVLCSGIAEEILGQRDPGSIVVDEIIAVPICFLGWMAVDGTMASPGAFLTEGRWKISLAILLAFRVFDIWKPWPVRPSQRLPGGWGVTVDDVLAALYVAALSGAAIAMGQRAL
jgi:phosphatidylglycerophosphatase A